MTFKARKEFPANSPLQLTLIRIDSFLTVPWLSVAVASLVTESHGDRRSQSSWPYAETPCPIGPSQGSRFGRELLVKNWSEICFYYLLIRYTRANRSFWSLKWERQVLGSLHFSVNTFTWPFAILKAKFSVKGHWPCRSVFASVQKIKFF